MTLRGRLDKIEQKLARGPVGKQELSAILFSSRGTVIGGCVTEPR